LQTQERAIDQAERGLGLRRDARQRTLEERVAAIADRFRQSSAELELIQAEIAARLTLAKKAKKDAEQAVQLASLNEEQRAAVARLLRAEVAAEVVAEGKRSGRRAFWVGFLTNFAFFALGVVATLILK
jgi:hypothetical protein